MAKLLGRCPKCQGNMYEDHGTIKCLQCGKELTTVRDRKQYYKLNREVILETVATSGRAEAMRRYKIASSSLHYLLLRWQRSNGGKPGPAREPATKSTLPGLPAFSDSWPAEVQIKWLEVWAERSK